LLDEDNAAVYAYSRTLGEKKLLILLNFTAGISPVDAGIDLRNKNILCCNYEQQQSIQSLRPYEAVIYEL
jgi:hypothetical protein